MTPPKTNPLPPLALGLLVVAALAGGCSEGSSLSTSSILGGGSSAAAATPTPPVVTPTSRALQVGATAARATRCGYNFDANKLRNNFLAAEAAQAPGTDQTNVVKTYDTAFAGVSKAAAGQPAYCTDKKTQDIKADLTRHLAGDYSPGAPKEVAQEDGGLFSGWGSGGSSDKEYKQTMPTDNRND